MKKVLVLTVAICMMFIGAFSVSAAIVPNSYDSSQDECNIYVNNERVAFGKCNFGYGGSTAYTYRTDANYEIYVFLRNTYNNYTHSTPHPDIYQDIADYSVTLYYPDSNNYTLRLIEGYHAARYGNTDVTEMTWIVFN